jgi:hypothetical protein
MIYLLALRYTDKAIGAAPPGFHPRLGRHPRNSGLFSCPDEKRDCYEANDHQGGASDEHVTDMMSCGARSHGDLVLFSDDWTFVRIHRTLISRDGKLRPEFREIAAKGTKSS